MKRFLVFAAVFGSFFVFACSSKDSPEEDTSSSSTRISSSSSSSSENLSLSSSSFALSSSGLAISSSSFAFSSSSSAISSSSSILSSSSSARSSSSSATVTANSFDVYIAFGQSNMQGPAEIRQQDKQNISERFQVLNVVAGTYAGENRAKGKWYKAVPPLIIPDANLLNHLGLNIGLSPSNYFGITLTQKTPENIKIGVIPVASGDLALAAFHKTRGDQYYNGQNTISGRPSSTEKDGMNRYKSAGYANLYDAIIKNAKIAQEAGGVIKGIIVHQGESGVGQNGITWANMLKEIYNNILEDLGLPANSIPIVLGQLWNSGNGPDGVFTTIKSTIPNAWVISSSGCTGRTGNGQPDNIHFGSAGIQLLGERYGEKMFELVYATP